MVTRSFARAGRIWTFILTWTVGLSVVAPAAAQRHGAAESPRPTAPPPPAPEAWRGLIGEYAVAGDTLYIRENRGRLEALFGGRAYSLVEIGPSLFRFPAEGPFAGDTLEFRRDARGVARHLVLGGTRHPRMTYGVDGAGTYRITPVRPVAALRPVARAAQPPEEEGDVRRPELVDLATLDEAFTFDIRYATDNNFMGAVFYREARAFLQRPAAEALVRVQHRLRRYGYGLHIFDAYRPWFVTRMFWDATPEAQRIFVADPANGSRHNRGAAVDLTLYDLETGKAVAMPSGYDEFSPRAFVDYPGGTSRERWHRDLLRRVMEREGFQVYRAEWWHYDYHDWRRYPILNTPFEALR